MPCITKKRIVAIWPVCCLLLLACTGRFKAAAQQRVMILPVNTHKVYQTIHNFGASDAWSCQFVGAWPNEAKNAIADWLFSTDTLPNGNPKGIGLSLWRYNLGAGSTQQGDSSGIKDSWRRAESFFDEEGHYNWQRCQGQQWFLTAAKQRGVQQFLGFFNSPPVPYTQNGKAYATKGRCNISSDKYDDFARYTVNVVQHIRQATGIAFNYISPVNEPQWNWSDGGQEGCPYTNGDISRLVKAFNTAFEQNELSTQLIVPEAGSLVYLAEKGDKPGKGSQVNYFFEPSSPGAIGHLSHVKKVIAGHSYFTTSPFTRAIALRKKLAQQVAGVKGLSYWQSEYCILGDNAGEINGSGKDTGMQAALYLARCIHADLVAGNAAAWQWWMAISPYNYKDGLIYIDKNVTGGRYTDSKMLWALGNYSRLVRPGMQRVAVQGADSAGLLSSAYIDAAAKKLVVVVINNSQATRQLVIGDATGKPLANTTAWNTFTTSATARLDKQVQYENRFAVLPNSIVTIETKY